VEGLLLGLIALACPVGMGLMMWFMGRRARNGGNATSLDDLRADHRRLGVEIERLEDDSARSSRVETPR
jgi:hypothetical protein